MKEYSRLKLIIELQLKETQEEFMIKQITEKHNICICDLNRYWKSLSHKSIIQYKRVGLVQMLIKNY